MTTQSKLAKPVDLSAYAEEVVPFDAVMRKILSAKPTHRITAKPKPKQGARKRK